MKSRQFDIFLSGGTGLVGTNLILRWLKDYPEIRIKTTYNTTDPFILNERIEYVKADLSNKKDCKQAVAGTKLAVLAGAVTGGALVSRDYPQLQMTNNLLIDATLLEAIYEEGIKKVIYFSSATIYQDFEGRIKEEDLDLNQSPLPNHFGVGWAKRTGEKLCEFWNLKYNIEFIILRCSYIFGPYSKFDPYQSNFIPALIRRALNQEDPYIVYGHPDQSRDILYVEDLVNALMLIIDKGVSGYNIFNLGSSKLFKLSEVAKIILDRTSFLPDEIKYEYARDAKINLKALDCSKLNEYINWYPSENMNYAIESTVHWWKENNKWWNK